MERPKTPNPIPNPTGEESRQKEPKLQIVQTYKDDAFFQKVIAENRTEKGKHIAIIGEPGAGKTTLLGELAERLPKNSPNFPICIRLADLRDSTIADYLLNNWLAKALQFIDSDAENVTPEIRKELKQLFAEGKVWLLLDGVDEMAATSPIEALARIREQLTDWVGKARVVLTCRLNVWDAAISNTLTNFDTYKTLEFEPDDVDEFIRQWFEEASHDEKRRNSGNENFWREQGKRLTRQLKEPGKERIKELVRNPLRLSMLCQSWCVPEQELPETKAALYEQFTIYFFEWKQEEFEKKQRVLNQRDKKQIQQALGKLALAAMESVNRFRIEQDFAIEQMDEEWFNLADELGWLVLVDRDTRTKKPIYAFFHPTFQEYFAACAIGDWHFFLNHQIPPVSCECYRIFEKQWREVILLWLGRGEIERKQKEEFIDALVNFEDGCVGFYRFRALFLAAAGIAEFQDYSQIDEVIKAIVTFGFGYFNTEKHDRITFFKVISNAAREALQQTQSPKAINTLVQLLKSYQLGCYTRLQVAESLGNIDPGNQNAINTLTQLLKSEELYYYTRRQEELYYYTRRKVAERLENIYPGNQNVIDTLAQQLLFNLYYHIRRQVAESLGKIDPGNQNALDTLAQLLKSNELDDLARWQVAESLGKIGQGNQNAIHTLLQLLSSNQLNENTRRLVAESLGKIDPGNQNAINTLVQLLKSNELYFITHMQVAESLGKIGQGNQNAIHTLLQLLSSNQLNNNTRRLVAESLGNIDPGNQNAIDTLLQLLSSNQLDDGTRWQVTESLGKIGQGNPNAIHTLVQLLSSDQLNHVTRMQVAVSLGKIDPGNQKAINTLVQLLSSDQLDDVTHMQVTESLGKIGQDNQNAINTLLQLLSSDQLNDNTRRQVAESLGKIDPGNQNAIDTLVQLISSNQLDNLTHRLVTESLGKIGQGNQNAINALVQLLSSNQLDDFICIIQVAENLGKIGQGNQNAINALVQVLSFNQLDDDARWQVAEILEKIPTNKQLAVIKTLKVNFNNSQQIDEYLYKLIWHYGQNLPYPDFYQAWHQDTLTNSATASLNIANLPQILAEAINERPDLCSKVKLICIDSDKFGNPENPATKIYNEMRLQGCDKSEDSKPKTMAELQDYWDELRIESEIPLFFICYDSTALSATPTGFNDSFLKALSKFDGAICVVCEQENIPLPTFSPSQPDLVAAVVAWIRRSLLENRHPI
ncbi:NACHT domain-containing protein [Microcoleus vaginatus PCC 9802]|uniref:HEAT repeat domain-containing protein n=1 Tax=Microcoleus vaginatus TaxID=119532 RepID=UPI00020D27A8|nr:putative signal transduction protein with Nacht domain [Microcoleus vaginatus FGP-2]UNU19279.1 NACHT domain-containing protein [Microcoleus vaginatus PCC 9802]